MEERVRRSADFAEMGCSAEHHVWVRFAPALFGNLVKPRWQSRNEDFDRGDPSSPIGLAVTGVEKIIFWSEFERIFRFFLWRIGQVLPSSEIEHEGRSTEKVISPQLSVLSHLHSKSRQSLRV